MGEPTNGATKEAVTKIQYLDGDAAAQAVAQSVAALMGVATVETDADAGPRCRIPTLLADNTVLVLLGDDKAGKTLAQMVEPVTDTIDDAGGRDQRLRGAVSRSSNVAAARSMHHSGSFIARSVP